MEPYEIIGAPLTLWLAPVGTAFPLIDAAPAAGWIKVGTSGDLNYSDDGVTVTHSQTFEQARPAGSIGPRKAWRQSEDLMISLTLWDLTLEQYATALNDAEITTTAAGAGTAGFKKLGLSQGEDVAFYALLARGVSPYGDGFNAQYEVPRCYQSGNPKPAYKKGVPAGLELEFTAFEDTAAASANERFGRLIAQHQAPL
jgi:hypothetical protein